MRGETAIPIQVPTAGLIRNVPIQEAPQNSLVDGQNVFVDDDGLLKTRLGYSAVGPALVPAERITGIIGYRDQSGVFQEVVGTLKRWQKYNGDGTFTDISGTPLNGDADDPVRFTPFAQGGVVWVFGVNNIDPLTAWNSSLPAYVQVVGGIVMTITAATASGTTDTITFTSPSPPGLKIGDTVVIAGVTDTDYNGTWIITGVGLNTFTFTNTASGSSPSSGGTAVDAEGGAPFSTARDVTVLANRVVVVNTVESGTRFFSRVRWSAVNDGFTWPALAVNDMLDANDQIVGIVRTSRVSAIIYRDLSAWLISAYPGNDASAFTTERISVVDNMTGPCSPAAIVVAEGYHFYLGQDGRVYKYDGNTIAPISDAIDPVVRPLLNPETSTRVNGTYLPNKRGILFFFPALPESDPFHAVFYSIRRNAFEPLMRFPDAITASAVVEETTSLTWNNWVPATSTWPQIPFASWDSIPSAQSLNCWTAGINGLVWRFFSSSTDDGIAIPYFAEWPPLRQDPSKMQRAEYIELYLSQSIDFEFCGFILDGLLQPYQHNLGTPIMALAINLADENTFQTPILPGPNNPRNMAANYLWWRIHSAGNLAQFVFAGGTIFVDLDDRGDYGLQ